MRVVPVTPVYPPSRHCFTFSRIAGTHGAVATRASSSASCSSEFFFRRGTIAPLRWPSRVKQAPLRFGNRQAIFPGRLDPEGDRLFPVLDGGEAGLAVGHASGQLGHIPHQGLFFLAPPNDLFLIVVIHNIFYCPKIFPSFFTS